MPHMLRSRLIGYVSRCLAAMGAMLVAMAPGSGASAFDIKKVEASVYKVFATPKGSTGTGFLVSGRRTVITNFHVIEKNTEFMVIYRDGKDVQVAAARVIAYKPSLDLAVLRVDRDLPGTALTLGDFEPDKLTNVVTVGFPAAADDAVKGRPLTVPELIQRLKDPNALDPTVTTGVVSRMTSAESPQLNARTVQHNAAINPGNSGGPLFDKCANVMGVNTLVALNSQGLFFSIHSGEVVRVLREHGIEYASVRAPCLVAEGSRRRRHDASAGARHERGAGACRPRLRAAQRRLARRAEQGCQPIDHAAGEALRRRGSAREAAQPSQFKHWGKTSAMSLLSTGGGRSYSLGGGRALTVGRGQQCQITIDDDTVSSAHARLQLDQQGERVSIADLNSSNGTFLNGKRITSGHARIGDVVRFGTAEFKLAAGGASGVVTPAPRSAPNRGWMLSGFDPSGRALQFELRPMVENGSAGEAATTWIFGRDKARAQFVIDDGSVSGAHAEITYEPLQGLTLRDLGSTNGTRLDGEMLGKGAVPLDETGQEITFGAAKLRLSRLV